MTLIERLKRRLRKAFGIPSPLDWIEDRHGQWTREDREDAMRGLQAYLHDEQQRDKLDVIADERADDYLEAAGGNLDLAIDMARAGALHPDTREADQPLRVQEALDFIERETAEDKRKQHEATCPRTKTRTWEIGTRDNPTLKYRLCHDCGRSDLIDNHPWKRSP